MGINRSTAETWVKHGRETTENRGGNRPRSLSDEQVDEMICWLEDDGQLTLQQLKSLCLEKFGIVISTSTIARTIDGKCFKTKKIHHEPISMNLHDNKEKRKKFVE